MGDGMALALYVDSKSMPSSYKYMDHGPLAHDNERPMRTAQRCSVPTAGELAQTYIADSACITALA